MQRMFDSLPTIDAVPVVRCRECKYHKPIDYCTKHKQTGWFDDDFCSYGQRKEANLDEAIEKYLKIIDSIHGEEGGQHEWVD